MAKNYRTIQISLSEKQLTQGVGAVLDAVKNVSPHFIVFAFCYYAMDKDVKMVMIYAKCKNNGQRLSGFYNALGLDMLSRDVFEKNVKNAGHINILIKEFLNREKVLEYSSNLSDIDISSFLKESDWKSLIRGIEIFDEKHAEKAGYEGKDFLEWCLDSKPNDYDHIGSVAKSYIGGVEKRVMLEAGFLKKYISVNK